MSNTQHTVRQLAPAVGETVYVRFEEIAVRCHVIDAKNSWGKVRLEVKPAGGLGSQWIELGRLVADPFAGTGQGLDAVEIAVKRAR
jgi:hypothetical protein